jgi:hypothetical protein
MHDDEQVSRIGPGERCGDPDHRVVRLRFSYTEASIIRARLISDMGADRVSRLRRTDGGWAMVICRECASLDGGEAPPMAHDST